jgi:hypothetical protein
MGRGLESNGGEERAGEETEKKEDLRQGRSSPPNKHPAYALIACYLQPVFYFITLSGGSRKRRKFPPEISVPPKLAVM